MSQPRGNDFDVVVAGSGAGGLTAAAVAAIEGHHVVLLEAAAQVGGTTAFSGGMAWLPDNPHMSETDTEDSPAQALEYVLGLTQGHEISRTLVERYINTSREMVEYLAKHTPVRFFASQTFSDYFADQPGGKRGGRSLLPQEYALDRELGEWSPKVRRSPHFPDTLNLDELELIGLGVRGSTILRELEKVPERYYSTMTVAEALENQKRREREGLANNGVALAGRLLRACLDAGVTIVTNFRVTKPVIEDGRVTGVIGDGPDGEQAYYGSKGVILATGGFERNKELVHAYINSPIVPMSVPSNQGDGLLIGLDAGAGVGNMTQTIGQPSTWDGQRMFEGAPLYSLSTPRRAAGCIAVNSAGKRFTNEGAQYSDIAKAFQVFDPVLGTWPNEIAWVIFDRKVRDEMTMEDMRPGEATPRWVKEADSIEELAVAIDVDPAALGETVTTYNEDAAKFSDPAFRRGELWYNNAGRAGEPPEPRQLVAPVDEPPYFATRLYDGALGTAGGLLVNANAQVTSHRGAIIPGLYGAGNVIANPLGPRYPGGGSSIGPAMVFGYIAGRHVRT